MSLKNIEPFRPLAKLFLQKGQGTANGASFNEIVKKGGVK
jgi:hypothetical protein